MAALNRTVTQLYSVALQPDREGPRTRPTSIREEQAMAAENDPAAGRGGRGGGAAAPAGAGEDRLGRPRPAHHAAHPHGRLGVLRGARARQPHLPVLGAGRQCRGAAAAAGAARHVHHQRGWHAPHAPEYDAAEQRGRDAADAAAADSAVSTSRNGRATAAAFTSCRAAASTRLAIGAGARGGHRCSRGCRRAWRARGTRRRVPRPLPTETASAARLRAAFPSP